METRCQLDNLQRKDGKIYARCYTWRPDFPITYVIARIDMDRDCGKAAAQLFTAAPVLLKALKEIDALTIDKGLDVTAAESPERDLLYRIHTAAVQAIRAAEYIPEVITGEK